MSKRKIQFERGHYYHIFNRGVSRNRIFYEDKNYVYLLRKVKKLVERYDITIIAYCLMPNHYHFLVRQNSDFLVSVFIQNLFNIYSKAFNKMYNRSGTLFEGSYKAKHVHEEAYLLHLCRYIHRNPIDADTPLVSDLKEWRFSNYPEWINDRSGDLFDEEFVREHFVTVYDYVEFVMDYEGVKKYNEKCYDLLIDGDT